MKKNKRGPRKYGRKTCVKTGEAAGTYIYDKNLGRIVKVSDRIPGISGRGGKASEFAGNGGCGRGECGSGSCAGLGGGLG